MNREGDHAADSAIHIIGIGGLRLDARSQDYVASRIAAGNSKLEAMRCLKRYIAMALASSCGGIGDQSEPARRVIRRRATRAAGSPPGKVIRTDFVKALAARQIRISMDGRGVWRDNLLVECLWRRIK